MTNKWILINLLLIAVAATAGYRLYDSVNRFEAENDLASIEAADTYVEEERLPAQPITGRYSPLDFAVVADKNLFSETRSKDDSTGAAGTEGNIPASQKPTLVGVILAGEQRVCTLLEPRTRGRRTQQTVLKKVGDTIEGYTITEIESDHIVLDNGNQRETIYLNDPSQPAQRRRTANLSTRVIPIGGGAATANTPVIIVSSRPGTTRGATAARATQLRNVLQAAGLQQANGQTGATSLRNMILPALQGALGTQQQMGQPNVPQPSTRTPATQVPSNNNSGTQGGSRVVRTPFGDIIRNP